MHMSILFLKFGSEKWKKLPKKGMFFGSFCMNLHSKKIILPNPYKIWIFLNNLMVIDCYVRNISLNWLLPAPFRVGVALKDKKGTFSKRYIIYINRPIRKKYLFSDLLFHILFGTYFLDFLLLLVLPLFTKKWKSSDFLCTKVPLLFKPWVQYPNNIRRLCSSLYKL